MMLVINSKNNNINNNYNKKKQIKKEIAEDFHTYSDAKNVTRVQQF